MVLVTLVGERWSRVGEEFVFEGPNAGPHTECRPCKLKAVCWNLEEGRHYRILGLRSVHHSCALHEGGVRVAEVEKIAFALNLPRRLGLAGGTITFEEPVCGRPSCAEYRTCHPLGARTDLKYRVQSVEGSVDCPAGFALVHARVE